MSPRARLRKSWKTISTSLWFIPTLCGIAAIGAAIGLVEVDRQVGLPKHVWFLLQVTVQGARSITSAIASSTITVLGVIFSITIVVLTLASNQYTSRVLRNFTSDRGNQTVLGIFIGTFVYALLVLRTTGGGSFVPVFSVTFGIVLALASVGALIYFIGHVAQSIQAANIISRAAEQTVPLIETMFPEDVGRPAPVDVPALEGPRRVARAPKAGYVQFLDGKGLMRLAERHDVAVRMECLIGEFVPKGGLLASIFPAERADDALCDDVQGYFALGRSRTMDQDVQFGLSQVTDIAIKGLSPGINDPSQAMTCIDHLRALMLLMARRDDPVAARADDAGHVRLIARGATFESMLGNAFSQIRQYGKSDVDVVVCLLQALTDVGAAVRGDARRRAVWRQGAAAAADARGNVSARIDRERVNAALQHLSEVLQVEALPHVYWEAGT